MDAGCRVAPGSAKRVFRGGGAKRCPRSSSTKLPIGIAGKRIGIVVDGAAGTWTAAMRVGGSGFALGDEEDRARRRCGMVWCAGRVGARRRSPSSIAMDGTLSPRWLRRRRGARRDCRSRSRRCQLSLVARASRADALEARGSRFLVGPHASPDLLGDGATTPPSGSSTSSRRSSGGVSLRVSKSTASCRLRRLLPRSGSRSQWEAHPRASRTVGLGPSELRRAGRASARTGHATPCIGSRSGHAAAWGAVFCCRFFSKVACRRTIAVTMAPVPPLRAARRAEHDRTSGAADAELRRRHGFAVTARTRHEHEATARREIELAEGHAAFRFTGYLAVTADDEAALAASCGHLEQAAAQAQLELHRMYGAQEEAYTCTLPTGRGCA